MTPELLATEPFRNLAEHVGLQHIRAGSSPPAKSFKSIVQSLERQKSTAFATTSLTGSPNLKRRPATVAPFDSQCDYKIPTEETQLKDDIQLLNKVVNDRLMHTLEGLASAAVQTNSWLLHTGIGMCGEVLLERITKESCLSPTILMLEYLDSPWLKAYELTRTMADKLKKNAISINTPNEVFHTTLSKDLWSREKSPSKNSEFLEHGMDWWSFKTPGQPGAGNLDDGTWHPHLSWPNPCNTHYIFFTSSSADGKELAGNAPDTLNLELLAPLGGAFIACGPLSYSEALQNIFNARPTVVFKNTGMGAHELAIAIEAVQNGKSITSSGMLWHNIISGLPKLSDPTKGPTQFLSLSQVKQLFDLAQARPEIFNDTIRLIDPFLDSAEDVLASLSTCFASCETGVIELGVGTADEDVVYDAWVRHYVISQSVSNLRWKSSVLTIASWALTFFTTLVAVVMGYLMQMRFDYGALWNTLTVLSIVLPAAQVLVTASITQFKFDEQYSDLSITAAKLLREIYRYRTRVTPYSTEDLAVETDDDGNEVIVPVAVRSKRARMLFIKVVSELTTEIFIGGFAQSSLSFGKELFLPYSSANNRDRDIRAYVQKEVLNINDRKFELGDDCISKMNISAYINSRVIPVATMLQEKSVPLSWYLRVTQSLTSLVGAGGLLLSSLNSQTWLPVTVALGSILLSIKSYNGWSGRLTAINKGISNIQHVLVSFPVTLSVLLSPLCCITYPHCFSSHNMVHRV